METIKEEENEIGDLENQNVNDIFSSPDFNSNNHDNRSETLMYK